MPELPEVETVTRALIQHLIGRSITKVTVRQPRLRTPLSRKMFEPLLKKKITNLYRRAKYIVVEYAGSHVMLLHLGMTGSFRICLRGGHDEKHEHVIWHLDNGATWRFDDPRRFGSVEVMSTVSVPERFAQLGIEPLDRSFNGEYLFQLARKRQPAIKIFIMDQRFVVGVGNIYAAEALYMAGIRPMKRAGKVSRRECAALVAAIKKVLRAAIRMGGTTIIDFKAVDGSEGRFTTKLQVYGREGESCPRCPGIIRRITLGGRSTFYCPKCQK